MDDSNTPIVLVVCNDYGELALALYLLANQSFARNTTLMLPPRLHASNSNALPGRTFAYHSLDDVEQELEKSTKGILGLFSGYLLPVHQLCKPEELKQLLKSAQNHGWRSFTSDPFLGLLSCVEARKLVTLKAPRWNIVWNFFAAAERKRLADLLNQTFHIVNAILHVYPVGESPAITGAEFGKRIHLHNDSLRTDHSSVEKHGSQRWLFILGDQDYTVQLGKHGLLPRKFLKLLIKKLNEALEAGRVPVLIAPAKVIASIRKRAHAADSIQLLSHCEYNTFQSLLLESEYVFYWNAVSFSCIPRTLAGKPWFTFDDGHLLQGMNDDYAQRISDWFYLGEQPPRLDMNAPLTSDGLLQANQRYLKSAARIRQALLASPTPESLVSALDPVRALAQAKALEDAFEIVQLLAKIVSANALDGSVVVDTALLTYPKSGFEAAVKLVHEKGAADQATFAKSAAPTLAFFQPHIGAAPQKLDSQGKDGNPWRTTVEAEMVAITNSLSSQ